MANNTGYRGVIRHKGKTYPIEHIGKSFSSVFTKGEENMNYIEKTYSDLKGAFKEEQKKVSIAASELLLAQEDYKSALANPYMTPTERAIIRGRLMEAESNHKNICSKSTDNFEIAKNRIRSDYVASMNKDKRFSPKDIDKELAAALSIDGLSKEDLESMADEYQGNVTAIKMIQGYANKNNIQSAKLRVAGASFNYAEHYRLNDFDSVSRLMTMGLSSKQGTRETSDQMLDSYYQQAIRR